MTDRTNVPLERMTLGELMFEPRMIPIVVAIAPPEDWHHPQHALALTGMRELSGRREPIDPVTIEAWSKGRLDAKTVSAFLHGVSTAVNVEAHAKVIAEHARARRLAAVGASVTSKGRDPAVSADELEAHLRSELAAASKRHGMRLPATGTEMAVELFEEIERSLQRRLSGASTVGVPSGLDALDDITTGWHPGITIIGARPGTGKSALAHKLIVSAAETQKPALMFQIEMRRQRQFLRMVADRSGIEAKVIRSATLNKGLMDELEAAAQALSRLPLFIDDDGSITLDEIRARTLRMHSESPLSIVVVDYLQKIKMGGKRFESREREVNEIVGGLAALAKEINTPIVALAALNRECEGRPDKRPMASDIRESGGVESDADVVVLLYRASKYRALRKPERAGIVEAIVAKNREGEEGTAVVGYVDAITRFADVTDEARDAYVRSWDAPEGKSKYGGGRRSYGDAA